MAEIAVLPSLESAKGKLEQNGFPFAGLPNDRNDSLWTRIEEKYGLSLAEVSFLKNASAGTTSKSVMFHCSLISIPSPTHIPIESLRTCATILCLGVTINTTSSYVNTAV